MLSLSFIFGLHYFSSPPPSSLTSTVHRQLLHPISHILLLQFIFTDGGHHRRVSLVRTVVRLSPSVPPSLNGGLSFPHPRRVSLHLSSPQKWIQIWSVSHLIFVAVVVGACIAGYIFYEYKF